MIQDYIDYFTKNPEGYWFKAKLYGWGWTPVTWQGWLVVFVFTLLIYGNFFRVNFLLAATNNTIIFFALQTFFIFTILIYICYKTGERPRWQWGPKNKK